MVEPKVTAPHLDSMQSPRESERGSVQPRFRAPFRQPARRMAANQDSLATAAVAPDRSRPGSDYGSIGLPLPVSKAQVSQHTINPLMSEFAALLWYGPSVGNDRKASGLLRIRQIS
ncbi:MAG TPA: hypothetical protein VKA94_15505 [Hyphomicrobiales bacterium]|nr:hypothetical protein [Hyphomicrobiales bacterium]